MSEIRWTEQQLTAIREVRYNMLVTAAAGSGKTAVLAQRCTHLLSQANPRANVEDLLVLTFNESAANEMRRRIRQAFMEQVKREPATAGAVRQLALLDQAKILTVHAFCSTVIREYFYLLSLDPAYEILDGDESDLLKTQAAHEIFEGFYKTGDRKEQAKEIHRFLKIYGSDVSDRELIYLLTRLHNFLGSLGHRDDWLEACHQQTQSDKDHNIKSLHIVRRQREILLDGLDRAILRFGYALKIEAHGPATQLYGEYLDQTLSELRGLQCSLRDENNSKAMDQLKDFKFSKMPSRPRGTPEEDYQAVKDFIGKAKKSFKAIQQRYVLTQSLISKQLDETLPHANVLIDLHGKFSRRYEQIKEGQKALDFNDLEHHCLKLLRKHPEVAEQLHRRYKYILVDEYQDISPIQEEIIRTIHEAPAGPSNLFMVGDVKQSIYGFRRADPEIFLAKLAKYAPANQDIKTGTGNDVGLRVELNKNFRSRRG
ncbi:MAG: UvrD-helicase domain-containing protein, partial [Planctomycetes bacterium]|nr:UvrD-helicase domain-containing protein [Planctomycetota bacterium]